MPCAFPVLVALLQATPVLGQEPKPLGPADFAVGLVHEGMDSAEVRVALGSPDSVEVVENPLDIGAKLVTWFFSDVSVHFFSSDHVVGLGIHGPGAATPRGLRVGESGDRVKELYGNPTSHYENDWDYEDPRHPEGLHVLRITVEEGVVRWIYLGWLFD